MLDWAPILFGPAGNLADIGGDTVRVVAIKTIQRLDPVEIGELASIQPDIVHPTDARDAIRPEADRLVGNATWSGAVHRESG